MKPLPHIAVFLLLLLASACGNGPAPVFSNDIAVLNKEMVQDAKGSIRTGDIILRSGRDITSYRIRELSEKDKTYSHAGIAYVVDTAVYIYHIVPPELYENKADSILRMERLEDFAQPAHSFGFGIVRYPLSQDEIQKAIHYLDSLKSKKIAFDRLFDLTDSEKMYCSEMIDNTLGYASNDRIRLKRKTFTRFQARRVARYFNTSIEEVMRRQYITIDEIHTNPQCSQVHHFIFLK